MNNQWIETYTGRKFWPLNPKPEHVCIEDIAHALSNICRYTGHSKQFYSVAAHSLTVEAYMQIDGLSKQHRLYGLLHDASEAYICDIPRPIKSFITGYQDIELNVQKSIFEAFSLSSPGPEAQEIIKFYDDTALVSEAVKLMNNSGKWNLPKLKARPIMPVFNIDDIKSCFLKTFMELTCIDE